MAGTDKLPTYTVGGANCWHLIPDYMIGGLRRYIEHGIAPGHFLRAVLQNDLHRAVERADETNIGLLPQYIRFLYNAAPGESWGSKEKYARWIEQGGLRWGDDHAGD